MPRICLLSGGFNPPGLHHRDAAEELARQFSAVYVIPRGDIQDRPDPDAIPTVLRAALCDLAFAGLERVTVDLFDLEQGVISSPWDWQRRYASLGEVWHAVGVDQIRGGGKGESDIHLHWPHGAQAWRELRFVVLKPPQEVLNPADLPPQHSILAVPRDGSSRDLRLRLFAGENVKHLLPGRVQEFIQRYSLYTAGPPRTTASLDLQGKKLRLIVDPGNLAARQVQQRLAHLCDDDHPEALLVLGGDGTMLRAIREHWQLRLPFIGLNFGHYGFLMNEPAELLGNGDLREKLIVRRLPMLHVGMKRVDGSTVEEFCFNDAWVERSTGQTAWLRLSINDEVRLEKIVADGVLVSTAAGSTAYALSMGASPLLADTPAWLVVGSNVMRPLGWKSALLPMDARVLIENLEPQRRPLRGFIYNNRYDDVLAMEARISRIAAVELAFSHQHDMARKISDLQFGMVKTF